MNLSVIIPTLNEESNIGKLLQHMKANGDHRLIELIVVDGSSSDQTVAIAKSFGAVVLELALSSRANQMNEGAKVAKGDILYFVHADTLPPTSYIEDIEDSIMNGFKFGCYQSRFDTNSNRMRMNEFFTQFDFMICRGGDQTLFVKKDFFNSLNGYDESMKIMEEYDLIRRAKKKSKLKIMLKACLISTRKYDKNSYFRVNSINLIVFLMFFAGVSQDVLINTYKKYIKN
jgi:rSAM/selenodomain-associated transferase 2